MSGELKEGNYITIKLIDAPINHSKSFFNVNSLDLLYLLIKKMKLFFIYLIFLYISDIVLMLKSVNPINIIFKL